MSYLTRVTCDLCGDILMICSCYDEVGKSPWEVIPDGSIPSDVIIALDNECKHVATINNIGIEDNGEGS